MKRNMGALDKAIRLGIAMAIVAAILLGKPGTTLTLVLAIAVSILVITSLAGTCLLYIPFNINTKRK